MAKTVVGLFDSYSEAQHVVQDLMDSGFRREDISVVSNDTTLGSDHERSLGSDESAAAEGAGTGAVSGTVLGGALGLLVGAGLLAIPGIGPVLAAGPLAAGIGTTAAAVGAGALGAGIGAATGGLIGGLVGTGVPKEHAEYYAEGVRRGGTLVTVNSEDAMAGMAHDILMRHNAVDIDERSSQWRSSGWSSFDDQTEPLNRSGSSTATSDFSSGSMTDDRTRGTSDFSSGSTTDDTMDTTSRRDSDAMYPAGTGAGMTGTGSGTMSSGTMGSGAMGSGAMSSGAMGSGAMDTGYDSYDNDYRDHYQRTFASAGYTYDDYKPVYQYGYSLANDQRYSDRDWVDVESDARTRWEEHNPGTWEQFKDSVQYAWDKVRGKR